MVVAAALVGTVLAGLATATPAAATTTLPAPTDVTVTPGVGVVTVSWSPVSTGTVTYAVTSSPGGLSCTAADLTSCTVDDRSSTPYRFTVVAAAPGAADSPASAPSAALAPHLLLIVAGQSNANGFESYATDPVTGIDYLAAPYTNGADTHDLLTWLPWSVLQGAGATPVPLDSPQQFLAGTTALSIFGPEVGLGRQLWADTGRSVTFVKAAYEGTSLAVDWSPSRKGTPPKGLFPGMLAKVQSVMTADAAAGQFDVLGGFYWYQGETDATKPSWADDYQDHLTALIDAVRSDLPISPTAPVVLAKEDISQYVAYLAATTGLSAKEQARFLAGNTAVRAADDWAAANLPDVREVDSLGLARAGPENIHLDNVSQLWIGEQMAKVSEGLLP